MSDIIVNVVNLEQVSEPPKAIFSRVLQGIAEYKCITRGDLA